MNSVLPQIQNWNNQQDLDIPDVERVDRSIFKHYYWGGRLMHIFPKDFHMSNMPVKMTWNLWYFGNRALNIYPYKLVEGRKQFYDLQERMTKNYTLKPVKW